MTLAPSAAIGLQHALSNHRFSFLTLQTRHVSSYSFIALLHSLTITFLITSNRLLLCHPICHCKTFCFTTLARLSFIPHQHIWFVLQVQIRCKSNQSISISFVLPTDRQAENARRYISNRRSERNGILRPAAHLCPFPCHALPCPTMHALPSMAGNGHMHREK